MASPTPATRVCKNFGTLAGCKFGDKCHFAHDATNTDEGVKSPSPAPSESKTKICKHFLDGNCKKGADNCGFAHERDICTWYARRMIAAAKRANGEAVDDKLLVGCTNSDEECFKKGHLHEMSPCIFGGQCRSLKPASPNPDGSTGKKHECPYNHKGIVPAPVEKCRFGDKCRSLKPNAKDECKYAH